MTKRIKILIEVDLDGTPGTFHTPESWLEHFGRDLVIPPWYNPDVQIFDARDHAETPECEEGGLVAEQENGLWELTPAGFREATRIRQEQWQHEREDYLLLIASIINAQGGTITVPVKILQETNHVRFYQEEDTEGNLTISVVEESTDQLG